MDDRIKWTFLLWMGILATVPAFTEGVEKCNGISYTDGTGRQNGYTGHSLVYNFQFHNQILVFKC